MEATLSQANGMETISLDTLDVLLRKDSVWPLVT